MTLYDFIFFEIFIIDHRVKRQARRMMLRDRPNVALVAKSVLGKKRRGREEREAVPPGLNQEILKR